jgi:glutamate racemase
VVLGCTHYPLVVEDILAALPPGTGLHDSSRAVAGQALRRLGLPEDPSAEPAEVRVHLGGDEGPLPAAALAYPIGRALARGGRIDRVELPTTDETGPPTRPETAEHPVLRGV